MNKLEQLMEQYAEVEQIANQDLSAWPVKTLPGAQMRQRECRTQMEALGAKYKDALLGSAVAIFLDGDQQQTQQFAKVAEGSGGTLTISAETMYEDLAKDIEPTLGDRRQFGTSQLGMLVSALTRVGKDLDFRNIPVPQIFDVTVCREHQDLIALVRNLVRQAIGDDLNAAYIKRAVGEEAIRIRYTRSVAPVVITNATADERTGLKNVFNGSFTIPVTQENTSEDAVLQSLTNIAKTLKSKKN
jgi:hypothetical protein